MLYILVKYLIAPFIYLFMRPIVYGRQNLWVKGKAILIANHRSMLDPILMAVLCPRNVHFMAKKELFDSKLAAFFLRLILVFPVNRKSADLDSLRKALNVLNHGKVFGIFPEGKRAITDSLDEFERGAAFLAIRSGAPVIPIYIHPDGLRRSRAVLIVGKPIDISAIVANAQKSSLVEVVADELADAVNSLRLELEEIYCE